LQELGAPRVRATPKSSLQVAVWALSRQTSENHGEIGERMGLTTRQVCLIVTVQQPGLNPRTERLARRLTGRVV
jgi:hypothetical protein